MEALKNVGLSGHCLDFDMVFENNENDPAIAARALLLALRNPENYKETAVECINALLNL